MKKFYKPTYLFFCIFFFILLSAYIFQLIKVAEETYALQSYQAQINEISSGNHYNFRNSLCLDEIEKMAYERDFTEMEEISYVEVRGTEVVVR